MSKLLFRIRMYFCPQEKAHYIEIYNVDPRRVMHRLNRKTVLRHDWLWEWIW